MYSMLNRCEICHGESGNVGEVPRKVLKSSCSGQWVLCSFRGVTATCGFRLLAGRSPPASAVQLHEPVLKWFGFSVVYVPKLQSFH